MDSILQKVYPHIQHEVKKSTIRGGEYERNDESKRKNLLVNVWKT